MSVSRSRRSLSTTVSLPERFRHQAAQSSSARARLEYRLSTLFSTSRNRAMTASDASLFYIPLYPEAFCEAQNATSGCSAGLELIEAAVSYVRGHYPYWTRTDGADHIVAVLNENWPYFTLGRSSRPASLEKTILLTHMMHGQTLASVDGACSAPQDIAIPSTPFQLHTADTLREPSPCASPTIINPSCSAGGRHSQLGGKGVLFWVDGSGLARDYDVP